MVQINLLPVTAKKKGRIKIELKIKLKPVIFTFGGLMLAIIVIWAILGMRLARGQRELSRLDEQLNSSKFTLEKLDRLKEEKKILLGKLEFLDLWLKREVLWAKNLNQISKLVPPGIWLKDIALHIKKEGHFKKYTKLDISGSAISLHGEEMINLIGGFMTAIERDETFSEQFSEIKLISSQRSKKAAGIEAMDFKLSCQFK